MLRLFQQTFPSVNQRNSGVVGCFTAGLLSAGIIPSVAKDLLFASNASKADPSAAQKRRDLG
jgi:hypothetical protein